MTAMTYFCRRLIKINMKKIYLFGFAAILAFSATAQTAKHKLKTSDQSKSVKQHSSATRSGNTGNQVMATYFTNDFSNAADWTMSATIGATNWTIGTTPGQGTYSLGAINSTTAANGYALFDSDFGCDGDQVAHMTTTNSFSTLGSAGVRLQFQQLYGKWYDSTRVYVSTNGTNWTLFEVNDQYVNANLASDFSPNPETVTIDISSVAANQATVWLRFTFYSPASVYSTNAGCGYNWVIDDVIVDDIPSVDAAITAVTVPNPDCDLTATEQVSVDIQNNGATPITGFSVSYDVNGGTPVTETFTATIAAGATGTHVFAGTANFSTPAVLQTIAASVTLAGDGDATNDKDTSYTMNVPPTVDTLYEDLEQQTSLIGWEFLGNNPNAWYFSGNNHTPSGTASLAFNNGGGIATADDWIMTNCVDLVSTKTYYIQYWSNVPAFASFDTSDIVIETFIGSDNTISAMTTSLGKDTVTYTESTYALHKYVFTVATSGTYNIGFHATNYMFLPWFRMDDIVLGEEISTNINTVEAGKVSIYPNPSNGIINVNITSKEAMLAVYNVLGEQVINVKAFGGNNTIDLSSFSAGTYFVRVTENEKVITKKINLTK